MELTYNQVASIYEKLNRNWDDFMKETKVNVHALYSIISFKKTISGELEKIQEMAKAIMQRYGAQPNDKGILQIPPENIEQADKDLIDFGNQTLIIECNEIELSDADALPAELLEMLFDIIKFK